MNYDNMSKKDLIYSLTQKDCMLLKLCEENKKLNYLASTDAMTGVFNRKAGLELLETKFKLSNINNENLVVCFLDVDKLKTVNDTFGHQEGDKLLINAAKILKKSIRKTDFIIRMGGDEFLAVFPETIMKEVDKIWMKVLSLLEKINKNNQKYKLSFSYGFYEYNKETEENLTVKDLIKKADRKMYKTKRKKGIM
ncbi:GGDEF domain-containing protein [Clostridium sp. BJN0001]|uniref:GGDEF domain-containing protein n=1 Tax=Clostridium sp. BJN0001 TaxID=2930219 RepID=UPI001FD51215|nr:GGDEF domain-containing protein [Clostridium sp. BJN0001]